MVGIVLPVYMPGYLWWVYSLPYHGAPTTPWVYHSPTLVRCCIRCHRSGNSDEALGSVSQKPMGESPSSLPDSQMCDSYAGLSAQDPSASPGGKNGKIG